MRAPRRAAGSHPRAGGRLGGAAHRVGAAARLQELTAAAAAPLALGTAAAVESGAMKPVCILATMTPTISRPAAPCPDHGRRCGGAAAVLVAAALLAACATQAPAPGQPPPPGQPQAPTAPPSLGGLFGSGLSPALESQRTRLEQALKGTPVRVEATDDRRLRVEVPTKHAFDPGRAAVKPALAAVLDQLAIGFRPQAATTELQIGAPADDQAPERVVQERGQSTRDYLIGRGVPISRIAGVGRAPNSGLEIVIADRPVNKP